ncbi:hypothetical protein [Sphingomonas sp. RS2018]
MTPIDSITVARPRAGETPEERYDRVLAEDQRDAVADMEPFARDGARAGGGVMTPSRRHDGWTAERQRKFLTHISEGLTVNDACAIVGLSAASAYAFRARARGAAFNIGWNAALLLQRNRMVDELTQRAFRGQTDTIVRPDGSTVERHRYDNRLALALLTRLDKIANADLPDRTGDARAARLAAQEWDRYLDLIGEDAGNARAGLFLALRVTEGESAALEPIAALGRADCYVRTRAGVAGEVDTADLDPAARADGTADQWRRAEAAGLLALAPEPEPEPVETLHTSQLSQHSADPAEPPAPPERVWWDDQRREWVSDYPPPPGFDGWEEGDFGDDDYVRSLGSTEEPLMERLDPDSTPNRYAAELAERDALFEELARQVAELEAEEAEEPVRLE